MKKYKLVVYTWIICILLLSGCSKPTSTIIEYDTTKIEKTEVDKFEEQTIEFNLGDNVYVSSSGREMPYKLRGILSVPEGEGQFPLVFIVHGNHNNEYDYKRFDTGFGYLTKYLAKNGYIAIALDLNQAYIWKYGDNDEVEKIIALTKKHLSTIKEANEGEKNNYPIDLKNKIDMSNIGLIGHSRGGEIIFDIGNELIKKDENITSLIAIAPAMIRADVAYLENDIDTAILVPELDGDVISLDGYVMYDILSTKDRVGLLSLTLLENANHNYFNANVEKNDANAWEDSKDISKQLSREEQEMFLEAFSVDFFDASMKGKVNNTLYDDDVASVENMYGYDVKNLLNNKSNQNIVSIEDASNFVTKNASIDATQYSVFYKDNKIEGLNIPGTGDKRADIKKLINFKWETKGSSIGFKPNINNFSEYSNLQFDILVDPSSELNQKVKNQSFTIQIKDKKGNIFNIMLAQNIKTLEYTGGKLEMTEVFEDKVYYWNNPTTLTTIKIPFKDFKEVDLNSIEEVSFVFDKTESGSIIISRIAVD